MNVTVHLFARARDLAQSDMVNVELPAGATVGELRRRIAASLPALAEFLPRCALAVDEDFAEDVLVLPASASVAVIPPVSGGCEASALSG